MQGGVFWGALGAFVLIALWRIWGPARDEDGSEDGTEHGTEHGTEDGALTEEHSHG